MSWDPRLPYANAQLLAVTPESAGDSYRGPAAAPAARWTGALDVYAAHVEDTTVRKSQRAGAEESVESRVDAVELTLEAAATVPLERGDTVRYRYAGVEHTRRVRRIVREDLVGLVCVTCWAD